MLFSLALVLIVSTSALAEVSGPITDDFKSWLNANGYQAYNFERSDLGNYGSFGGIETGFETEKRTADSKDPVIFVHGLYDQALQDPSCNDNNKCEYRTGWTKSIEFFLDQDYTSADLYASTWSNMSAGPEQWTHNCYNIMHIRKFIEAVIGYTQAPKVDIISHSLGVTLARKAIRGGSLTDEKGVTCEVGEPLTKQVDTFVGIAGANQGICSCHSPNDIIPMCNPKTGLYPGKCGRRSKCTPGAGPCARPSDFSSFLNDLNSGVQGYEGEHRFGVTSYNDEILGVEGKVWNKYTSFLPDGRYGGMYGDSHTTAKSESTLYQYRAVNFHSDWSSARRRK